MDDFSWTSTFGVVDLSELPGMLVFGVVALIGLLWLAYGFCKAIDALDQNDWRPIETPPKAPKPDYFGLFRKNKAR